jgi:Ran GTPase-activating protein (RanGAP) involved in mRNA processing and transport
MLEDAIRAGDCIAMLVEHFHDRNQMREAYSYIKEMEDRKIALHPYIDAEVLNAVYKAVGKQPSRDNSRPVGRGGSEAASNNKSKGDEDDEGVGEEEEEVVEEEVEEEVDEVEDDRGYSQPKRGGGGSGAGNGRPGPSGGNHGRPSRK